MVIDKDIKTCLEWITDYTAQSINPYYHGAGFALTDRVTSEVDGIFDGGIRIKRKYFYFPKDLLFLFENVREIRRGCECK
jgi:hypothetical protein